MPTSEPVDARVVALSKELERHGQRVHRNERVLQALSEHVAEQVAELAEQVAEVIELVNGREAEPPRVRSWLLADDPAQAGEDVADLLAWLGAVYLRYPGAELPVCWLWHPAIVEELWWLRCAHHDAYQGPAASYARAADWHDRQRPGVAERLHKWQRGCDLSQHQQPQPAPVAPLPGSADRIASAWAAARSTPHPTAEELSNAQAYEDERNQKKTRR